ncbi:MAG: efflux RND transporter periplasmic adaptor subunit [Pseudomonadota bacterium]
MNALHTFLLALFLLSLVGCGQQDNAELPPAVRGLKTVLIEDQQNSSQRRYPSVLQPSESTELSFQVSGKLGENKLSVGQSVQAGEILLSLNKRDFALAVDTSRAALEEARASVASSQLDVERKRTLRAEGVISQIELDNAETAIVTAQAKLEGAESQLETAEEELAKADLLAPYNGVINSVSARSFNTINPGTTVATLYNPEGFEAQFSVSYEIASRLALGKPVSIRLADNPSIALSGSVTELANSTTQVSSYPVVVTLRETDPSLRVGMAVEVAMEIIVTEGEGYTLPMSAIVIEGTIELAENLDPYDPQLAQIFVYDETTSTVQRRMVAIGGIRGNSVIIVDGLNNGDRVAVAGVSFLREGQEVKLLADNK